MISCLIFALALSSVGDVPIHYGLMTCHAADEEGVERVELGALLLAENHGGVYDPTTRGRHGLGGEYGLMQLHGGWARFCGVKRKQLLEARTSIECGALVVAELQRWHGKYCHRYRKHDWRVHWRCENWPDTWISRGCRGSIRRVMRQQERLEEAVMDVKRRLASPRPAPRSPDPGWRLPHR